MTQVAQSEFCTREDFSIDIVPTVICFFVFFFNLQVAAVYRLCVGIRPRRQKESFDFSASRDLIDDVAQSARHVLHINEYTNKN